MTEVFDAARKGDLEKVRSLVEQGINKEAIFQHGKTPLHVAAEGGHLKIVQYLVSKDRTRRQLILVAILLLNML
jgi:ankyrin repeat protein